MRFMRKINGFVAMLLVLSLLLSGTPIGIGMHTDASFAGDAPASQGTEPSAPGGTATPNASDEAFMAEQRYSDRYVTDGLVGLYTAYSSEDIDLKNGIWRNRKSGAWDGILRGNYWEFLDGGVGYRMTVAEWKADGTKVGLSLPDSFARASDFYTEIFATAVGITEENGERHVNHYSAAVTDASGTVVTPAVGERYGFFKSYCSAFRFELISTLFFCSLDDARDAYSLGQRWYLYNGGYPGSVPPAAYSEYFRGDGANCETTFRTAGPEDTPTPAQLRVGKTSTSAVVRYTYSYGRGPEESLVISSARHAELLGHTARDAASVFSLFNAVPATVYAIRVYSRELLPEEVLLNSFIDKAAYYRLDLSDYDALSAEKKKMLHTAFEKIGFSNTRENVLTLYNGLVSGDVSAILENLVSFVECRPILCENGGYRLLFSAEKEICDLLIGMGFAVEFGGLVASAETVLDNASLTVDHADAKVIRIGGEGGTEIYYETVSRGKHCFSIALTASDPANYTRPVRVRGYARATTVEGQTVTVYTDAFSDAMPDGSGSIASVTDYFVNRYEGDIKTACEYVNSAVLRRVLAASDIDVRTLPETSLSLYVDPKTGSDDNDGKTPSTAYATLETAFSAAKAYLGMAGTRMVEIRLSAGTHVINAPLSLSGEEIAASEYSLRIIGAGEETVVTTEKQIGGGVLGTDPETGAVYLSLPRDGNGGYPELRAVYGDGKLLTLAHRGDCESLTEIVGYRVEDALGNALPTVSKNDWQVADTDAPRAKYSIYTLPASLFGGDLDAYHGAEMHYGAAWMANVVHIDHVNARTDGNVDVYVLYEEGPTIFESHKLKGQGVWLENAKVLLKENSDTYYYDRAQGLLYYKEGKRTLDSYASLSYATCENIFVLKNVSGVDISDMTLTGLDSRYIRPDATAAFNQAATLTQKYSTGNKVSVSFMTAAAVYGTNVKDSHFDRLNVTGTLGAGIFLAGKVEDIRVDSCAFTELGEAAIRLGNSAYRADSYVRGVQVTNNYVRRIGTLYKAAVGIQLTTAADCQVIGNTVMEVPYSAFSIGWIWSTVNSTSDDIVGGTSFSTYNTEVAYNYVTDFMTCMGDGGAFYLLGGNVTRTAKDKTIYNFLHHNYVNASEESGKHGFGYTSGSRNLMCYYHDNSSSNWHDYENVLINTMETDDRFFAAFHQAIEKCEAQNNRQTNNYFVGFDSLLDVYREYSHMLSVNSAYGISARDYVFPDLVSVMLGKAITNESSYNFYAQPSPANAKNKIGGIFAASGSTLYSDTRLSGLTWTSPAPARVLVSDTGMTDVKILLPVIEFCEIGDVTMDGKIDERDAWAIKQHVIKSRPLSEEELVYSDVNGDGKTDAKDAMRILQSLQ